MNVSGARAAEDKEVRTCNKRRVNQPEVREVGAFTYFDKANVHGGVDRSKRQTQGHENSDS